MIVHRCMCGAEIELNETEDPGQMRCPECGMSVALGRVENSDESNQESSREQVPLFELADTRSIDREELLALSKSTSKVCSGIRAFRIGVVAMILCAFSIGLAAIFKAYDVHPVIAKIATFTSYGLAILTAFYGLMGWYYWSKVLPRNLTIRRNLLRPLLATSKFGFWILFFIPVAAGFFFTDTWIQQSDVVERPEEKSPLDDQPVLSEEIDPLALEKRVDDIVDVPSKLKGGLFGKVGMGFLFPAIILPSLLTLSIFQIKRFIGSWRIGDFNEVIGKVAIAITLLLTLLAVIPVVGFLMSVVIGLFWNRQLTEIGNDSLKLLSSLSKVSQE